MCSENTWFYMLEGNQSPRQTWHSIDNGIISQGRAHRRGILHGESGRWIVEEISDSWRDILNEKNVDLIRKTLGSICDLPGINQWHHDWNWGTKEASCDQSTRIRRSDCQSCLSSDPSWHRVFFARVTFFFCFTRRRMNKLRHHTPPWKPCRRTFTTFWPWSLSHFTWSSLSFPRLSKDESNR